MWTGVINGPVEPSISPPSQLAESPKTDSKPTIHIREPSFSYGCEAIFEVQSTKLPVAGKQMEAFYAGASLNSSQVLSPQDVFPVDKRL